MAQHVPSLFRGLGFVMVLAATLLLAPATQAAPYGFSDPSAFAMATAGGWTGGGSFGHFSNNNATLSPASTQIFGGAGLQSASAAYTVIPGNSASSQSSSSFGVVRVAATFLDQISTGGISNHSAGVADAGWTDLYTISHPLYDGQSGVLTFLLHAEGTVTSAGWARSDWSLSAISASSLNFLTQAVCDSRGLPPCTLPVNSTYAVSVPFVFGSSFDLMVRSLARAGLASFGSADTSGATGSVDFVNTIYWAGVNSVTVGSVPITGYQLTSASGVDYTQSLAPSTAVPEPYLFWPVSIAIAGLACGSRPGRLSDRLLAERPRTEA